MVNTSIPPVSSQAAPVKFKRRRILTWLKYGGIALLALPLVLAGGGALFQAGASAVEAGRYPPTGQLVDVGGYRLHLHCLGEGAPTVILDAANQGTVSNWAWIQPAVADTTRVCAYDRAGLGWSDLGPAAQDTRQNAAALNTLLGKAGETGPYVLVGHSFGGLFVRMYAEVYPEQVAGLVFVEGTLPDGLEALGLPDVMPNAPDAGMMEAAPIISRLGILRLMGFPPTDPDLPEPQRSELQAYLASSKWADAILRQYRLFPTLLAQVRPLYMGGSLGDRPLAVILGTDGDGGTAALRPLFDQQAALSSSGAVYVIEGANHVSLVDRQDHAARTAAIIVDVVTAVRRQ
jgi:pimeloyl-ACP methyl ester carboxylesterase